MHQSVKGCINANFLQPAALNPDLEVRAFAGSKLKFMKYIHLACVLIFATVSASFGGDWKLENKSIAWRGNSDGGTLHPTRLDDKINGKVLVLGGGCFQVELGDGTVLKSSDFKLEAEPKIETLKPEPDSPVAARHFSGRQLVAKFSAPDKNLSAEWRVILRDGSTYV